MDPADEHVSQLVSRQEIRKQPFGTCSTGTVPDSIVFTHRDKSCIVPAVHAGQPIASIYPTYSTHLTREKFGNSSAFPTLCQLHRCWEWLWRHRYVSNSMERCSYVLAVWCLHLHDHCVCLFKHYALQLADQAAEQIDWLHAFKHRHATPLHVTSPCSANW